MKNRTLTITTLLALDAGPTAQLPLDNPAAIGTTLALILATSLSCRSVLRVS